MAESISVSVKSRSGGRIYLDGTACGDTGKYYCISYGTTGAGGDIPNSNYSYTFWLGGCLGIGGSGCYIPDNGDGTYRIYLDEVTKYGCGDKIRWVDSYTLVVEAEACPLPNIASISCGDTTPEVGQNLYFSRDGEYGGSGHYIVSRLWTFGDGGSATTSSAYHKYTSPGNFTVRLKVTNDCGKSYTKSMSIYVSEPTPVYCDLDFIVLDKELYAVSGAACFVGGKSATTNASGQCSVTLECNKSYTATCNAPSKYTCSCVGCKCTDGPFTLTGDAFITFSMDKVPDPIVYCQQDFKVLDQNGDPVEYAIVGCEDRTDYTNFDVLGHAGTGTQRDGTVSTLKTIKDRSYNFYMSQYPAGYDFDIDGDSIFMDVIACTREVVFRIKNLSVVPDPCSVNVCVQDQDGNNISGVAVYIKDVGTVYTKDSISMFGCTGKVGLICGRSVTVTATVPDGYEGVKTTETFTSLADKTIILSIKESPNGDACAGKTKAGCDASADCYWWDSDNACHDTPEHTTYPTLEITSDLDVLSGVIAYVNGTESGVTPVTITFTEGDIGGAVTVSGVFAGIMGTKEEDIVLKAGSNEVGLELLMDNKEILAGGTVATALLINYGV